MLVVAPSVRERVLAHYAIKESLGRGRLDEASAVKFFLANAGRRHLSREEAAMVYDVRRRLKEAELEI